MDNSKEIIAQIKNISLTVTENTYDIGKQQGYELMLYYITPEFTVLHWLNVYGIM